MHISHFQLFNYKSFRDSGALEFKPGINIIVGANNAGKTALLEALTLSFETSPHRSIRRRSGTRMTSNVIRTTSPTTKPARTPMRPAAATMRSGATITR